MSERGTSLLDLEYSILRLKALGAVVSAMGAPRGVVSTEAIGVLGAIIEETAGVLWLDFKALHAASAKGVRQP